MRRFAIAAAFPLLFGCATAKVNMEEPRRVVGTENAVRVDAEIGGDQLVNGGRVPITYEITNQRANAIAVADLIPETSYDPETRLITITIGSEVPGEQFLPRLILIAPGEKKSFTTAARLAFVLPRPADMTKPPPPTELRLKVNFLGNTEGFQKLIEVDEKVKLIADAKLADELFPKWLERNEVVYTGTVPMRWTTGQQDGADATSRGRVPVRRRGGI